MTLMILHSSLTDKIYVLNIYTNWWRSAIIAFASRDHSLTIFSIITYIAVIGLLRISVECQYITQ